VVTFLEVSKLVTGYSDIGGELEQTYAAVMSSRPDWEVELERLLAAADEVKASADPEAALMDLMRQRAEVGRAAQRLAHLWYTGRLPSENKVDAAFVSEQAYFGGLIWRAARAHPPGLSGGYSGHWRYAPDG
jgi:lipopolysaccharide biosynthesis regulator YciM